jgi:hypothetical protein
MRRDCPEVFVLRSVFVERFDLRFDDADHLLRIYNEGLRDGNVTVPGLCFAAVPSDAELILHHPVDARELMLRARIIEITQDPPTTRLELVTKTGLAHFVRGEARLLSSTDANTSLIERLRRLTRGEQIKLARTAEQPSRVALERICGKDIWEVLLRNPRITIPEIARIARKGTAPAPLLDMIVDNKSWAKAAPIRRALLTNPRLSLGSARRVLTLAPKLELKVASKQTAYPAHIRELARKMSRGA